MIFSWFRDLHRESIQSQPFPPAWEDCLHRHFAHFARLTPDEQQQLRQDVQVFIAEKYWEGCGGLELTEDMQVLIAAQACLLTLHREHEFYPNVESIFVYPTGYAAPQKTLGPGGIVEETLSGRLGEAWQEGPVVLSWADVQAGGQDDSDGENVVYHEFAHKLDMRDGQADGVPRLEDDTEYDRWADVMSREFQELAAQSEHGHATLLNAYGATNAAEFFAVATECFFEKPRQMQHSHAALYEALRDFYRQDPAAGMTPAAHEQGLAAPPSLHDASHIHFHAHSHHADKHAETA